MNSLSLLILTLTITQLAHAGAVDQYDGMIEAAVEEHGACLAGSGPGGKDEFCQGSSDDKKCMKALIKAMIELESGGQPGKVFDESNYQKGMKDSVGLLQLSKGECVPEGDNLTDPKSNIRCGVRKFCELVKKDGTIAGADRDGAAKYWSVLRNPYNLSGAKGGIISVGKRKKVIQLTQQYLAKQ